MNCTKYNVHLSYSWKMCGENFDLMLSRWFEADLTVRCFLNWLFGYLLFNTEMYFNDSILICSSHVMFVNYKIIKNGVFWDVRPCRYCVNRRFGGAYRLHLQGIKIRERGTRVSRWLQHSKFMSRAFAFPSLRLHDAKSSDTALNRLCNYLGNI
jgi:hypothetical protein